MDIDLNTNHELKYVPIYTKSSQSVRATTKCKIGQNSAIHIRDPNGRVGKVTIDRLMESLEIQKEKRPVIRRI